MEPRPAGKKLFHFCVPRPVSCARIFLTGLTGKGGRDLDQDPDAPVLLGRSSVARPLTSSPHRPSFLQATHVYWACATWQAQKCNREHSSCKTLAWPRGSGKALSRKTGEASSGRDRHEADRLEVPRGRASDGSLQTADRPGCGERAVGREAGGPGGKWRPGSGRASWALLGPWPWLPERREPREVARSNARLQRLPPAAEVSMLSGAPTR